MIKHIVFDVDRTLVDSFEPELISLKEALETVLNMKMSDEQMSKLTTLTTADFFKSIGLNEEEIKLVNKEWDKTFQNTKTLCFPGIKNLVKTLYDEGYTINILTSRTMEEYRELDEELSDISPMFNEIVTSDIVSLPKPNNASMVYLCDKLNSSSNEVIYIGDSISDKEFSINSNCFFIPACWESKALIEEENACTNPVDILERVKKYR